MNRLFLLDAYALIYRAYYGFIKKPLTNAQGMNTGAVYGFLKTLQDVLQGERPTHVAVCFDPHGGTFRHREYPPYKAQREAQPEDITVAVPYVKRILEAYRIPTLEVADYEADDVIGTLARLADARGDTETFMLTPDKDYFQLVTERSRVFRPKSFGPGYDVYGVEEVLRKYGIARTDQVIDLLGLMGDAADNVPGCPGVGEKTALKLITDFGSIEGLLAHTDRLKGALLKKVTEHADEIRLSRHLVTICRDVPGVELDMERLAVSEPDTAALAALFDELGFRRERERLAGAPTAAGGRAAKARPAAPVEPSLFDEPAEAGVPAPEPVAEAEADVPAAATLPGIESVETDYILCDTPEKRADLVAQLVFAPQWAFDTETTSLDVMQAELVGISFAVEGHRAWYVPVPADAEAARAVVEELRPLFESEAAEKVAQNLKYDYTVLRRYGVEVAAPVFDTMIAHYLLQPEQPHGMDYLAEVYLKYRPIPTEALLGADSKKAARRKGTAASAPASPSLITMRDLPVEDVMRYCCEDSDVTFRLAAIFREELRRQPRLEALFRDVEMPLVRVLAEMELTGVRLDTAALREGETMMRQELAAIDGRLAAMAGHPFNPLSPKAVGEVLFDEMGLDPKAKKTRSGQYVTSEEVLQKLTDRSPIVGEILSYRGIRKLLSTYIEALPAMVNPQTGRIHTSFNQTVTATGRLSSSNPNLQNIPIRDAMGRELRRAFVADEGEVFFSADYSQIELRLMAHLSEDPTMIEAFRSGLDIHAATAAKVYHVDDPADVTKEQRTRAKTANFGIIYGISTFGLASRLNIPRAEAKELIDGYFRTYPRIKAYMDESIEQARRDGYVETLFGRRRMLPDIHSQNATVRGYAERNAINAPIQGTAADIIKIAMVRIARRLRREGLRAKLLIQVHDELNFSVPPAELERLRTLVLEEMAGAAALRVPLVADCGVGANWMEAH